jgi:tetratricopeptide (TPR) repeat protein
MYWKTLVCLCRKLARPIQEAIEMGNIIKSKKRWFLRIELVLLVCTVCLWVLKAATIDNINSVEAAVLKQVNSVKVEVLKQVVKIDQDNVEAYDFLVMHYERLYDFDKAAKFANRLVQIEPNEPMAWRRLGDEYASGGHYEKAIHAYKEAAYLKPDESWYHICLAFTYKDMHQYNEAIEELKQVIKMEPDKEASLNTLLGDFYSQAGQYENAISAYKHTLQLEPERKGVHYRLGKAYLQVDKKSLALEEYKILKTLDEKSANELLELINK